MTATNWISKIMTQRWTEIPNWWLKKTGDFFQRLARHIKLITHNYYLYHVLNVKNKNLANL